MNHRVYQAVGHRAKLFTTQSMIITAYVDRCDGHIIHLTDANIRFTSRDHPHQRAPRTTRANEMFLLVDQCSGWTAVDSL